MEKYENLGLVGEGSYGIVMKCRHKATGTLVAIKKFLESEDDKIVKRIANREIKMLKQLHHENLVNLIDLFKRKKKLFLVFEFVDYTLLDDLEKNPSGLECTYAKRILFQVLRGIEFCHNKDVIHRDIKPENILVSKAGIVKLCDFGFARPLSGQSNSFTDYVATRWYRAPELLVGDTKYGKPVDIWAIGCLTSEMFVGDPLFPGDSDIDQLFHIIKCIGFICPKHVEIFKKNALFKGLQIPENNSRHSLEKRYPQMPKEVVHFIKKCLDPTPEIRPTCSQLLTFELFPEKFSEALISEIKMKVQKEREKNPLLKNSLNSQSPTLSKNENVYTENSNNKMQTSTTKPPAYTKSTPTNPKNVSNLNFKSKLVENNQITNNNNNTNNNNIIFKNDFSLNNQENELFSENKNFVVVDEEAWEDVRPLTSRKERVASRAGRYPTRNEDMEYHIIEPPESVAADNCQKLEIDEFPKRASVMTNKDSYSRTGVSVINNTPIILKQDTTLIKINHSPRNLETPLQDHKLVKPTQAAFIQMKTNENSKLSNDRSLSNDSNVTRSSPIPTDISQTHPHYFSINSKKPIPTINNSINGNSSLPLKAPINSYNSIHQPLTTNAPFNNYSVKQNPNNLQRNFGFQIDNSLHPILPNIGKDSKFRQASFLFHGISSSNKSYIPSTNNSIFKSTSPMTNERSGLYYNASNKRRPLVNPRQNQNQEHNISLPELKGAEMPIRNQIYNTNIKYKNVIHKSSFLQNESQGNNSQMDNFTTREP